MKPSKSILNILRHKEEIDNQFNDTVQVRLSRLAGVARTVMRVSKKHWEQVDNSLQFLYSHNANNKQSKTITKGKKMPRTNINQLVENKLEADNKFNEVIIERIERLSKVAMNVLKKSGYNRRALSEDEIKSCFPEETHWVFDWNFARKSRPAVRTGTRRTAGYNSNNGAHIISVDSDNIHCILYVNGEVEKFVIPVRVLKFSDRDFAKLIREGVKVLRREDAYHEHVRREKHIRDMKDALAEMQNAIAKREKESARYNEQREAYIEESNARTRERHAELKAEREQERLERIERLEQSA